MVSLSPLGPVSSWGWMRCVTGLVWVAFFIQSPAQNVLES